MRLTFLSGDSPLRSLVFEPVVIYWPHMPASFVTEQRSPVLSRAQQAQRERRRREAEERLRIGVTKPIELMAVPLANGICL